MKIENSGKLTITGASNNYKRLCQSQDLMQFPLRANNARLHMMLWMIAISFTWLQHCLAGNSHSSGCNDDTPIKVRLSTGTAFRYAYREYNTGSNAPVYNYYSIKTIRQDGAMDYISYTDSCWFEWVYEMNHLTGSESMTNATGYGETDGLGSNIGDNVGWEADFESPAWYAAEGGAVSLLLCIQIENYLGDSISPTVYYKYFSAPAYAVEGGASGGAYERYTLSSFYPWDNVIDAAKANYSAWGSLSSQPAKAEMRLVAESGGQRATVTKAQYTVEFQTLKDVVYELVMTWSDHTDPPEYITGTGYPYTRSGTIEPTDITPPTMLSSKELTGVSFTPVGLACSGGCGPSPTQTLAPAGGGSLNNSSVDFAVNLGASTNISLAGRLLIYSRLPSLDLATPTALVCQQIADVSVTTNLYGAIEQVRTPQMLVNVAISNNFKYALHCFVSSNSCYLTNSSPLVTWFIENPDASTNTYNRLRITEKRGLSSTTNDYTWSDIDAGWTLTTGNGLRSERVINSWNDAQTLRSETRLILDPATTNVIHKSIQQFQVFDWGTRLVAEIEGDAPTAKTNTYTYYDTSGSPTGMLKQVNRNDGFWSINEYTNLGRIAKVYSAFASQGPTTTGSACRVREYGYEPLSSSGDDGTVMADSPRVIVEKLLGQEVGRVYYVYTTNETRVIRCQTPGATWTATDNLVTIAIKYADGEFMGDLQSILRPDGTMSIYEYSWDTSGNKVTSISIGAANTNNTAIVDGSQQVIITGPLGQTIAITNIDIASSIITGWEMHTNFDILLRPQRINYIGGKYKDMNYACCGVESETDQDGNIISYVYDALKRRIATVHNGITRVSTLDAYDNVLATTQIGTNNASILQKVATYDTAGRMLTSSDAMTNTTYYLETNAVSGNRVRITIQPDGNTRIETNNFDGSLQSLTGTAVHAVRYDYGVESESGTQRAYTKTINIGTNNVDTSEWIKSYTQMLGQWICSKYPDGAASRAFYNAIGQQWKKTDPDGIVTLYKYNAKGEQEFEVIDMDQNDTIDFDGTDRITRTTTSVGSATALSGNARITQIIAWNIENIDSGLLISRSESLVDGSASATISFGLTNLSFQTHGSNCYLTNYASDGRFAVTLQRGGLVISRTHYDAIGSQLSQSTFMYDAQGRQVKVSTANHLGGTTDTVSTYDNAGHILSITVADGTAEAKSAVRNYDSMGRNWRTVQGDGTCVTNEFLSTGEIKKTYGSRTFPIEYSYDYAGRLKTMKTWQNYAANSGTATTTWNYHSQRGWLTGKLYADGKGPAYTYTAAGKLATRTWARGIVTSYTYDTGGQLVETDYDDGVTPSATKTYDRRGRVTSASKTLGEDTSTMTSTLNNAGQILKESWSDGPLNGLSVTNAYDGIGRRTDLNVFNGSTLLSHALYSYDAASRLATVSDGTNSAAYYYLDNSPLLNSIQYKQNSTLRMARTNIYDILNRPLAIDYWTNSSQIMAFHYAYNSAGQRTSVTNVDGSFWGYNYDALGQVISGKHYWSDGTPVAGQQQEYAFDDIGNRLTSKSGGDGNGGNLRTSIYSVNALNQYEYRSIPGFVDILGSASSNATVTVNYERGYRKGEYFRKEVPVPNGAGAVWLGITNLAVLNNGTNADIISTNIGNVMIKQTPEIFVYDADGNLTADGQFNYIWDGENRLLAVVSRSVMPNAVKQKVEFTYDHGFRRLQKVVSSWNGSTYVAQSTNRYVYDEWNLVAEVGASGSIVHSYVWGADLTGSLQGAGGVGGLVISSGNFCSFDANGNVMGLLRAADGSETARYEYDPFGKVIRATGSMAKGNPFRFSTKYQDDETSLLYYGYRYLNEGTGRWLSRDPIEEKGGKNLYQFVRNYSVGAWDYLGKGLEAGFVFAGSFSYDICQGSLEFIGWVWAGAGYELYGVFYGPSYEWYGSYTVEGLRHMQCGRCGCCSEHGGAGIDAGSAGSLVAPFFQGLGASGHNGGGFIITPTLPCGIELEGIFFWDLLKAGPAGPLATGLSYVANLLGAQASAGVEAHASIHFCPSRPGEGVGGITIDSAKFGGGAYVELGFVPNDKTHH